MVSKTARDGFDSLLPCHFYARLPKWKGSSLQKSYAWVRFPHRAPFYGGRSQVGLRHRTVTAAFMGSNPIVHPILEYRMLGDIGDRKRIKFWKFDMTITKTETTYYATWKWGERTVGSILYIRKNERIGNK